MKKSNALLLFFILLASNLLVIRCDLFREKNTICFSGRVIDQKGNPVEGARISIGGQKRKDNLTAQKGEFNICTRPDKNQRYVVNIEKLGFGFVSKIYTATTGDILITMEQATVVEELNPNDNITITDIVPNTSSPAQPDYSRITSPLDTIPFVYDASGRLIAFGAPPEVERTYEAIDRFRPQRRGATVRVEADALEDPTAGREQRGTFFQASKSPLGNVTGSVSTVDVYSPDGMPGDYTTRMQNGERGFMITYGAVDVNFYSNGKPLQLKKGKFATISIPVDTLALIYGEKLPPTIPLLVYNKETGLWQRDGNNVGTLNASGTAYEAKISHFSVFNMDEEFAAGVASCYKMCISGTRPASAKIEITGDIAGHVKNLTIAGSSCTPPSGGCTTGDAYAINNMRPNTPIGVRLMSGATVLSSYVFITGGPSTPNEVNCSNQFNGCSGPVQMSWSPPCYQNSDAIGSITGPVLAVQRNGDDFKFSWIYVDTGATGTPLRNPPNTNYKVEYMEVSDQSQSLSLAVSDWTDINFSGSPTISDSNLRIDKTATLSLTTSAPLLIRVIYRTSLSGSYNSGSIYLLNQSTVALGSPFETDYQALVCYNIGAGVPN